MVTTPLHASQLAGPAQAIRRPGSLHLARVSIHHASRAPRVPPGRWPQYPGRVDEVQENALLERYLASLPPDTLRERLAAAADLYEPLRLRLLTEARAVSGEIDLPALKKE